MQDREFPIRTYVTLSWQLLLFSLVVTLVLDRFIDSVFVWLLPVLVLILSIPYLARVVELIFDMYRKREQSLELTLRDVSEEYAIAIHTQRGVVHWTLIFEKQDQSGETVVLSAAAKKRDADAFFQEGARYSVKWLSTSRVIRHMQMTQPAAR